MIDLINSLNSVLYKINIYTFNYIMKDDLSNNIVVDYNDKSIRQFIKDPSKKMSLWSNKDIRFKHIEYSRSIFKSYLIVFTCNKVLARCLSFIKNTYMSTSHNIINYFIP